MTERKTDFLILGAGISGCAAAREFQSRGADYLLLERNPEPGGLTRSINLDRGHFDYTGHFLHLARTSSPSGLPHAGQRDEDWSLIERKAAILVGNRLVPAPFQYNLHALPAKKRMELWRSYENRLDIPKPKSFQEYLLSGFGAGIGESFLFPYNEKLQAVSLDRLTPEVANRFFPTPDAVMIRSGLNRPKSGAPFGYSASFWYPKAGGIGRLASGLAQGLTSLEVNRPVLRIDVRRKTVQTPDGRIRYRTLLTSIPLRDFCALNADERFRRIASSLSHNRVLSLNLLFDGPAAPIFRGLHWIYLPDKDLPFYRIGFYSHLPVEFVPPKMTSVYVEAAVAAGDPRPPLPDLVERIFCSLEQRDWIDRKRISVAAVNWIDCAYIHFTPPRKRILPGLWRAMADRSIHPIGRYGRWDYLSMEDSILSGVETARRLLEKA